MKAIFVVAMLAVAALSGCASIKHGLGARAEQRDLCELTVVNETPGTFKFRVGHLWWEEQAGLLPHTSTGNKPMLIEQDEEHVLVRVFSVQGRVAEDKYYFYVPRGTTKHTITFGGLQEGVVVNRTAEDLRVVPPGADTYKKVGSSINRLRSTLDSMGVGNGLPDSVVTWGYVLHPGQSQKFKVMPGKAPFVFYYGAGLKEWYVEIRFRIDDVPSDVAFNGGYMGWVGYVQPSDLEQGWKARFR